MDLEQLLDLGNEELMDLLPARARRRMHRGLQPKHTTLLKKLRDAKKNAESGAHRVLQTCMACIVGWAPCLPRRRVSAFGT